MTLATVSRYDADGVQVVGDRAVVVGASMAGLMTARILADAFETVTVVDRDPLPDEPVARRGVPQSSHVHVLHEAGRATLEDLFPGYGEALVSAGGLVIDLASDFNMYDEGDFVADGPNRIPMYCASRPLFEQVLRRRVAALDAVELCGNCQFTGYVVDDSASAVEGVTVRGGPGYAASGGVSEDRAATEIAADLVVDATGRSSRTPSWLEDHGYSPPSADEVRVDLAYSTVRLDRPDDDRRAYLAMPAPTDTRGGGVFPVEGGRWLMTMVGIQGDHPPTDLSELADFAGTLPVAEFGQLLAAREVVSETVAHYPFPSNRRRHYWNLDRFPDGLVVVGDAIASFNPVYGQGMSVAALEALQLHHALRTRGRERLATRYFDRIEPVVDDAWRLAAGADFRYPGTTGPKPRGTDLLNRYLARLTRKAHTDGALAESFMRVVAMESRPTALVHPRVVWRVLKPSL
jgi:2-polyprenyl-6-methoxyphenol hydroxylase-like FAD-dependent oxidoreductase